MHKILESYKNELAALLACKAEAKPETYALYDTAINHVQKQIKFLSK